MNTNLNFNQNSQSNINIQNFGKMKFKEVQLKSMPLSKIGQHQTSNIPEDVIHLQDQLNTSNPIWGRDEKNYSTSQQVPKDKLAETYDRSFAASGQLSPPLAAMRNYGSRLMNNSPGAQLQ